MVPVVTGDMVELAFVDHGDTGTEPAAAAMSHGVRLEVVKAPGAKGGCVLLPRRSVVERRVARSNRFRRLTRDDERLPERIAGLHVVAFACVMIHRLLRLAAQSPYQALESRLRDPIRPVEGEQRWTSDWLAKWRSSPHRARD